MLLAKATPQPKGAGEKQLTVCWEHLRPEGQVSRLVGKQRPVGDDGRHWKGFSSRECGDIIGCGNTGGSVVLHPAPPKDVLQLYSRYNEPM